MTHSANNSPIDVVILQLNSSLQNGVVQYVNMIRAGLGDNCEIRIHRLSICSVAQRLRFPDFAFDGKAFDITIPLPINCEKIISIFEFWKNRYFDVVQSLISDYLKDKLGDRVIWHVQTTFLAPLGLQLKKHFGGTVVGHLHCIPWKQYTKHSLISLYSKYLVGDYESMKGSIFGMDGFLKSDFFICVTKSGKNYLTNVHGIDPALIRVVGNGVKDTCIGANTPKSPDNPSFEILFAGRVRPDKGVLELMEVIGDLSNDGYNVVLKIAGDVSKHVTEYYDQHRYRLERNVELLNQVPYNELCDLYKTVDVGIIPSHHEQCSYVAIEMMMHGMAIVATDVDGLSEMFTHEENALLTRLDFDPDKGLEVNREQLAGNIKRLIDDRELRDRLGRNARLNYEKRFTLDRMITETVSVYRELAEG